MFATFWRETCPHSCLHLDKDEKLDEQLETHVPRRPVEDLSVGGTSHMVLDMDFMLVLRKR